jgi:tetratricopeptide (TPR) repeat protein
MRQSLAMGCFALALALALPAASAAQIPQTFSNLQVLPKDVPRGELVATMRGFAGALGVRCTHCHVGPDNLQGMDFATDEKPAKRVARTMLRMVRAINADYVAALPASDPPRQPVTCLTCHRRVVKPPLTLPELLLTTIESGGVPAAIAQYKKLRAEMLDAGLYDFREPSLNIVATRLRDTKRFDEALEILRLNAAMFPQSVMVQINLGDTAVQKGDLALAAAFYERALAIEPGNPIATKNLESVRTKIGK